MGKGKTAVFKTMKARKVMTDEHILRGFAMMNAGMADLQQTNAHNANVLNQVITVVNNLVSALKRAGINLAPQEERTEAGLVLPPGTLPDASKPSPSGLVVP